MYHNVDEIEAALANLAVAYPTLTELIPLPEHSFENRPITCLRIGTNSAGAADGALFVFGHHAREWVPPEVGLGFLADMLHAYANNHPLPYGGKSYTAVQVHQILDAMNVFVVPCVNPDGRAYTMSSNDYNVRMWRRNRNTTHHATCHGVDLNRNYDFAFDLNRHFSASSEVFSRTSDDPCHDAQVYHGPSPFSESETRNVRWLLDTYPRIRWFIDIHGYKGEIYFPFGDDENQSADPAMNWRNTAYDHQRGIKADAYGEYISAADLATHTLLANRLKEGIQPVRGESYVVTQSFVLYPTSGASNDYAWARHLVDWTKPRVESFAIEHEAVGTTQKMGFQPLIPEKDEIVQELTSGLVNFCLTAACGVPALTAQPVSMDVVFNQVPEGQIASRPVILRVTGCEAASFVVVDPPHRTSGSTRIVYDTVVASDSVPHTMPPGTRELFIWLICKDGLNGDSSNGTVRVRCPETGESWDVTLHADFVRAPRAGAVLVLDRSGSMADDGGDGRTRLQVLQDSAPRFVDVAPPGSRVGLVRFATNGAPGAPMTPIGPEGSEPGRDALRTAIANHTLATGAASFTSIGDGVFDGNALIAPETGLDHKALVVLTDGHENRDRYLTDVAGLINDRVFAIGLGTPEQIQPIALDTLTNGTGGYLLMTGPLDPNDPYRLEKYYLQILAGVTNDQVVLDPDGWLVYGSRAAIPFYLNEADQAVDAIVLIAAPRLIRTRLRTPSGQILDASHPSLRWTVGDHVGFYRFTLPVPGPSSLEGSGRWELLLDWRRQPKPEVMRRQTAPGVGKHGLRYTALVHARSALEMTASLVQSGRTPGAFVTLRVRIAQYQQVPIDGARVRAAVRFPDGSAITLDLAPQGKGAYETQFTASLSGVYPVCFTAAGRTLRGERFTREAVRTASVWADGDHPPPTGKDEDWCRKIECLVEAGVVNAEVLKRLGIDVRRLERCCPPDEPEGPRPVKRRRRRSPNR